MANALVEKIRSKEKELDLEHKPVTTVSFQKQYLELDKLKRAKINTYYKKDSFLSNLLGNSASISWRNPRVKRFIDLISSISRRLAHMMFRFLVSVYSYITIRPVWKSYITRLSLESAPSK